MPELLSKFPAFALLSAVPKAISTRGICSNHCNTMVPLNVWFSHRAPSPMLVQPCIAVLAGRLISAAGSNNYGTSWVLANRESVMYNLIRQSPGLKMHCLERKECGDFCGGERHRRLLYSRGSCEGHWRRSPTIFAHIRCQFQS